MFGGDYNEADEACFQTAQAAPEVLTMNQLVIVVLGVVAALSVFYTAMSIRGCWHNWVKPYLAPAKASA